MFFVFEIVYKQLFVNTVCKLFTNSLRNLFTKRPFHDSRKQLFTSLQTVFVNKGMAVSHGKKNNKNKKQNWGSRRRTTTVPGARMSPLRTCPEPLGEYWRTSRPSEAIMELGCIRLETIHLFR